VRLGPRLELLGRSSPFALLVAATLASGLGTWVAFVALTVDVWDRTHSSVWVSALLAADFLPLVAVGLLLAPLVDRLSRRRVMIGADLVRCGVFALLPFARGPAMIVVLAAIAGFASGFFRPALYAGVPNLVDDDDLAQANSLLQAVENVTWMLTPPLAGVLVGVWNPEPGYWINAASFLVSAALLARIPGRKLQAAKAVSEGHVRDLVAGISLVLRSRPLLTVFVAWNVFFLAFAGINVAEISFAKDALDAGDFGFGLLIGASGLGLVLGSFFAGTLVERHPLASVYGGSIGLLAAAAGAAAGSPVIWIAAALMVAVGFGNGVAVVCNALFVQRGAPDELRGRAFTIIMSSNYAVLGVAMAAAGLLTDAVGPRWVWALSALFAGLAAVLAFWLAPRGEGAPRAAPHPAPN
jgi:MFS family permease